MRQKIKTYKFKLKLTPKQEDKVDSWINTSRCLYNLALETRNYAYKSKGVSWNYYELSRQLTELRKEFDWIKELPSNMCQDVLERQEKAFKFFFKGGGFPKFAKKDKYNSITFKNLKQEIQNRLKLEKLGSVKYFNSREIEGKLQRASIVRKNGNYYIVVTTKLQIEEKHLNEESIVGIDAGIVQLATLSSGKIYDNPKTLDKYLKKLRIQQRKLSRCQKGSNNRLKQKLKVSKLYEKITRIREDYLHKITTEIANQYDYVVVEDLKVSKMIKNKLLAKDISDVAWSKFFEMLEYKVGHLEKINPAYTSQTCSSCREVDSKSRISQSEFVCTSCGDIHQADYNASKNIKEKGRAALGLANVDR